jgi:hypothetical protein
MGQFDTFMPKIGLPTEGNRAVGQSIVVKKPKPKVAGAGSPPPNPPKDPSDKKEPAKYTKKKPPEDGMGALVRSSK